MSPERSPVEEALRKIADGASLAREEARATMAALLAGEVTQAEIGALLMGLRVKGETEEEVVGLVEAMRASAVRIRPARRPLVDLCGTGGDGAGTFNISTAASFVVAGAGVAVAKHGNRSASSRSGSADVLEALGVPVDLPPERSERAIDELGLGFLFAPLYHPAMRHVAGARRELKIATIFNVLGPLANPAGVERQLVGVFDPRRRGLLAGALRRLGTERAWVVHSEDGLDEVSPGAPTSVSAVEAGGLKEFQVRAEDFGLRGGPARELAGGDPARNAELIQAVLSGADEGPRRDAVLLNAAAAIVVAGLASDPPEACARARESLDSRAGLRVLESLRRFR